MDPVVPPCGCPRPGAADPESCYCAVDGLLRVIRRRYSLALMNALHVRTELRFNEIATAVPQASTSTLVETLCALETAHLLQRTALPAPGSHPSYKLTASGEKLVSRLRQLLSEVQDSGP